MILCKEPTRHAFTTGKVVLLSGLSDPATCALSAVQRQFLAALRVPETWKVYWNFPYVPCPESRPLPPPLWRASWHNLRQFVLASRQAYRRAARRHWEALRSSTEDLVVIALSCGLEIVNACLSDVGGCPRVRLVALGPVAWRIPRIPHVLIQGERDYISKVFFRKVDMVLPGVGHLAYFQHPRVLHFVNEYLCGNTLK